MGKPIVSTLMPAGKTQIRPQVVSAAEWQAARKKLLAKEKKATRARDALAAERRRQPMARIDKAYAFDGSDGKVSLLDLFEGRRQLLVYHFMFAPGVDGWPTAGCPGCSFFVDNIGHLAHLHARDTSFALVSRAPLARIKPYQKRMGWTLPWFSSSGSDFNSDFGVTTDAGESLGSACCIAIARASFARTSRLRAAWRRSAVAGPSST